MQAQEWTLSERKKKSKEKKLLKRQERKAAKRGDIVTPKMLKKAFRAAEKDPSYAYPIGEGEVVYGPEEKGEGPENAPPSHRYPIGPYDVVYGPQPEFTRWQRAAKTRKKNREAKAAGKAAPKSRKKAVASSVAVAKKAAPTRKRRDLKALAAKKGISYEEMKKQAARESAKRSRQKMAKRVRKYQTIKSQFKRGQLSMKGNYAHTVAGRGSRVVSTTGNEIIEDDIWFKTPSGKVKRKAFISTSKNGIKSVIVNKADRSKLNAKAPKTYGISLGKEHRQTINKNRGVKLGGKFKYGRK
jgi:hypothetical protein